ncbi:MAG: hypothetical protein AAF773_20230 [Cyanobacteria bacterium P01_D01_bin.115]
MDSKVTCLLYRFARSLDRLPSVNGLNRCDLGQVARCLLRSLGVMLPQAAKLAG